MARHAPGPGLLRHTDRGSTYTASAHRRRLRGMKAVVRMSRKGSGWDNAVAEATLGSIKVELFQDHVPEDLVAVRRALLPYINGYYKPVHLHSTVGYETPDQVHRQTTARGSRAA